MILILFSQWVIVFLELFPTSSQSYLGGVGFGSTFWFLQLVARWILFKVLSKGASGIHRSLLHYGLSIACAWLICVHVYVYTILFHPFPILPCLKNVGFVAGRIFLPDGRLCLFECISWCGFAAWFSWFWVVFALPFCCCLWFESITRKANVAPSGVWGCRPLGALQELGNGWSWHFGADSPKAKPISKPRPFCKLLNVSL